MPSFTALVANSVSKLTRLSVMATIARFRLLRAREVETLERCRIFASLQLSRILVGCLDALSDLQGSRDRETILTEELLLESVTSHTADDKGLVQKGAKIAANAEFPQVSQELRHRLSRLLASLVEVVTLPDH